MRRTGEVAGVSVVRVALAWLGHPVSVAGVAVLLWNDHVLKAEFGSWWTGKLSDIAGLVFAPALLAVVAAAVRPRIRPTTVALGSLAVVGVGFAWVKGTAGGAAAASAVWSAVAGPGVIRQDATDLLALPALALSWWAFARARSRVAEAHARASSASLDRTVGHDSIVARARALILVPVATLAVAATSGNTGQNVYDVAEWEGRVYVGVTWDDSPWEPGEDDIHWAVTVDGLDYTWLGPSDNQAFPPEGVETRSIQDCVEGEPNVCYRITTSYSHTVLRTFDGGETWYPVWPELSTTPSDADEIRSCASTQLYEPCGALVVFETSEGYVVVVGDGWESLIVRDTEGVWHGAEGRFRQKEEPIPGPAGAVITLLPQGIVWGVFLALVSYLAFAVAPPRGIRRGRPSWVSGSLVFLLGVLFSLPWLDSPWNFHNNGWDIFMDEYDAAPYHSLLFHIVLAAGVLLMAYGAYLLTRLSKRQARSALVWSCLAGLAAGLTTTAFFRPGFSLWIPAVLAVVAMAGVTVVGRRRMAALAARNATSD